MTADGVQGLTIQVEDVRALLGTISGEGWDAPSACAGWAVRDVVAHMGAVFHSLVDPSVLGVGEPGELVEQGNERPVAERRTWDVAAVVEEYESFAPEALGALGMFNTDAFAGAMLPLGDLGSYPFGLFADALCFDHLCHLHLDLLAPGGPLDRPAPPLDADRLGPTVGWMLAGLPQMCGTALAPVLDAPLGLVLTGPGGGEWTVVPGDLPTVAEGLLDPAAVVTSTSFSFVSWATKRSPWHTAGVSVTGHSNWATPVLDAINVV